MKKITPKLQAFPENGKRKKKKTTFKTILWSQDDLDTSWQGHYEKENFKLMTIILAINLVMY